MNKIAKGFTLIELLIVIAIIAILAAVVVLIINPLELMMQSRDSVRLADVTNLKLAISVASQEATASGQDVLCSGGAAPCAESSQPVIVSTRKVDGTGWVKANLTAQKSVTMSTLPVDPLNNAAYYYSYKSDGSTWEINATLESDKYKGKMSTDGGDNDNVYEDGSNLKLIN